MINSFKSLLAQNITNAKGWSSKRKIVVIESDDWGSIRMPSKKSFDRLLKKGIRVDKSLYDTFDSLEKKEDLMFLFEVLQNNGTVNSKPVFTFNTVIQNPDFEKIRAYNFEKFYGINLFDSYKQYYGEDLKSVWNSAIKENLMLPQYHAREHLNAYLWLKDLRKGIKDTKISFDSNFFGLKTNTSSNVRKHYLATYFSETLDEFDFVKDTLYDGVEKFEQLFGFKSKSFIASNYTWATELEKELSKLQFKSIQSQRKQVNTDFNKGTIKYVPHYTGQKNRLKQSYTVRNVLFEPYLDKNKDWAEIAFKQIENAFLWKTPAIICSHRINYVSNMCLKNRDNNLRQLNILLKKINNKYPDVLYLTSSQLSDLMVMN